MDLRFPSQWRKRDERVFAFLRDHSATGEHLAIFFAGRTLAARRKKAAKWLARQRRRKRVRLIGLVQRKGTGRPEVVYGRRCRQVQIEHEVRVADFAAHFPDCRFHRDGRVGQTEADGVIELDGRRCFVEIDNSGKMTAKQMEAKWRRYGEIDGFVLVVCLTEARLERLRIGAKLVRDNALFSTFDRLEAGKAWVDWYGKTVVIGRPAAEHRWRRPE